jgi:hypothetical protein
MRWRPSAIHIEFAFLLAITIIWLVFSAKYLLSYLAGF